MKRSFLSLVALSLVIAGHNIHASQAHLPCNLSHSVAAYARALTHDLATLTNRNEFTTAVFALTQVDESYTALAKHLEEKGSNHADTNLHFTVAQAALHQFLGQSARVPLSYQRVVTKMLSLNERLVSALI